VDVLLRRVGVAGPDSPAGGCSAPGREPGPAAGWGGAARVDPSAASQRPPRRPELHRACAGVQQQRLRLRHGLPSPADCPGGVHQPPRSWSGPKPPWSGTRRWPRNWTMRPSWRSSSAAVTGASPPTGRRSTSGVTRSSTTSPPRPATRPQVVVIPRQGPRHVLPDGPLRGHRGRGRPGW